MKVAILTWGSRGDFQPYLALSAAFRAAGHEVRLATKPLPGFAELAAAHGVALVPLSSEVGEEYWTIANAAIASGDPVRAVRIVMDGLLMPSFDDMYAACLRLARWSDVVVCHFLQVAGRMAAESARRPLVTGTLVPTQIPTSTRSPGMLPNLSRPLNRVVWRLAIRYMNAAWLPPINEARRRALLDPLEDVARRGFYSDELNLVAVSPRVFPRPYDWAPEHRMTGYWTLETPSKWQPPSEVADFLEQGSPPVVIGFGSMTSRDTGELTRIVVEAANRAGVRAIIEPGLARLGSGDMPASVLAVEDVPHSWLLPRASALVHHGGAGTSAAAFRAGIPSVFVPHVFDQFLWAKRAQQIGVAPPAVLRERLTVERLESALRSALSDRQIRDSARRLADGLKTEDGAAAAVELVEGHLSTGKAGSSAITL